MNTPTSPQSGNITITYTVLDANSDPVNVEPYYSTNDGSTWNLATSAGGDGLTDLSSSPSGTEHTFIWASNTDLPNTSTSVLFSFSVVESPGNPGSYGVGGQSGAFTVDNTAPPSLQIAVIPPSGEPTGDLPLTGQVESALGGTSGQPNQATIAVINNLDLWLPISVTTGTQNVSASSNTVSGFLYNNLGIIYPNGTVSFTMDFTTPGNGVLAQQGSATADTPYESAFLLNALEVILSSADLPAPYKMLTLVGEPSIGSLVTLVNTLESSQAPMGLQKAIALFESPPTNPISMGIDEVEAGDDLLQVFTDSAQRTQLATELVQALGLSSVTTVAANIESYALDNGLPSLLLMLTNAVDDLGNELETLYQNLTGNPTSGDVLFTAVPENIAAPSAIINSTNSATISWGAFTPSDGESVVSYTVSYDANGFLWADSKQTTGTSLPLTGLSSLVNYDAWVVANGNDGGEWALGWCGFNTGGTTPLSQLVVSVPSQTITAGTPFTLTVAIQNQYGNTLTTDDSDVTIALNPDPTLYGTTTVQAINGIATFSDLYIDLSGIYSFVATDATDGISTTTPSALTTVTPATPDQLVFVQQPTNTMAGNEINPVVTVDIEDQYGNVLTSDDSALSLAIASGPTGGLFTHSSVTTVDAVDGVATFENLTLDTAGTYILAASDATDGFNNINSSSFNITSTAASKLVFIQQPTNTIAGNVISPALTVAVEDQYGNIVTTNDSYVTLALGNNSPCGQRFNGVLTVQVNDGVATFSNLSLTKAGTYILKATDGKLASATSSSFQIFPAAAVRMVFIQAPLIDVTGKKFGVEVELLDKYGNMATNDASSVTLSLGPGLYPKSALLSGTLTANVVNGIAAFHNLSINDIGFYTLLATDSNGSLFAAEVPILVV